MDRFPLEDDLDNAISCRDIDVTTWPKVDVLELPEKKRQIFTNRMNAIHLYLKKTVIKDIKSATGIDGSTVVRLLRRCLEMHQDGRVYGYRALIPNKRIKPYERKKEFNFNGNVLSSHSGAFTHLLNTYPTLKEVIRYYYLGERRSDGLKPLLPKNMRKTDIHKKFLEECVAVGLTPADYPYTTEDKGKRSLYRYLNKIKLEEATYSKYLKQNEHGDAYKLATTTGGGDMTNPIKDRPFEVVEFDEHLIDAIFVVHFENISGVTVTKTLNRIWLLCIIDKATRVILGYSLCFKSHYSSYDVLKCVRNAVVPHHKIDLTIPGFHYPENGGYHSLAIPSLEWALFDEILYDNDKSHLSQHVQDRLKQVVGCTCNAGPVATPTRRPIIERFFKTLESRGYQRLVNTTGGNSNSPKRNNPEEKAIEYNITVNDLIELTEMLIAQYNNTAHQGIGMFSPLRLMEVKVVAGMLPRIMDPIKRQECIFLEKEVTRKICGKKEGGRRPYVTFEGVRYTSSVLQASPHLIGKKLSLVINTDDLRTISCFLDGEDFGILKAKGQWGIKPHDLHKRKAIAKWLNDLPEGTVVSQDRVIDDFERYIEKKAETNKTFAGQVAANIQYMKEKNIDKTVTTVSISNDTTNKIILEKQKTTIENLKKKNIFKGLN